MAGKVDIGSKQAREREIFSVFNFLFFSVFCSVYLFDGSCNHVLRQSLRMYVCVCFGGGSWLDSRVRATAHLIPVNRSYHRNTGRLVELGGMYRRRRVKEVQHHKILLKKEKKKKKQQPKLKKKKTKPNYIRKSGGDEEEEIGGKMLGHAHMYVYIQQQHRDFLFLSTALG